MLDYYGAEIDTKKQHTYLNMKQEPVLANAKFYLKSNEDKMRRNMIIHGIKE